MGKRKTVTGNGKTEGIGMKEANDEMRRTIRQERSNVLVEVAHLDTKEAVAVLIAAINERALESGLVSEVRFRPLVVRSATEKNDCSTEEAEKSI